MCLKNSYRGSEKEVGWTKQKKKGEEKNGVRQTPLRQITNQQQKKNSEIVRMILSGHAGPSPLLKTSVKANRSEKRRGFSNSLSMEKTQWKRRKRKVIMREREEIFWLVMKKKKRKKKKKFHVTYSLSGFFFFFFFCPRRNDPWMMFVISPLFIYLDGVAIMNMRTIFFSWSPFFFTIFLRFIFFFSPIIFIFPHFWHETWKMILFRK